MSIKICVIIFGLIMIAASCKSSDTSGPASSGSNPAPSNPAIASSPAASPAAGSPATAVKSKIDSCKLLTSDELKQVQGEPLKEALKSDRENDGLIVSQCYYSLPTATNSVVLNVTTATEDKRARDPRAFWKETFVRTEAKGSERDRERDRDRRKKESKTGAPAQEGEGEEESAPPQKVTGLGDDAYWLASPVGGALYVLKKDAFFRISVGGAGDANSKLNKSKTLARKALARL